MYCDTNQKHRKWKLSTLAWALSAVMAPVSIGAASVDAAWAEEQQGAVQAAQAQGEGALVKGANANHRPAAAATETSMAQSANADKSADTTGAADMADAGDLDAAATDAAIANADAADVDANVDSSDPAATGAQDMADASDADSADSAESAESVETADAADAEAEAEEGESLTEQTQEAVGEFFSSVWSDDSDDDSSESTTESSLDPAAYSATVDPFAKQQSSWIESLLGQAITDAQASKENQDFNFFVASATTDLDTVSSGMPLSTLLQDKFPDLSSEQLLQDSEYKQSFITAFDRGFSYISYLFHQNNPYRSRYKIPVVFLDQPSSQALWQAQFKFKPFAIGAAEDQVSGNLPMYVLDRRYDQAECRGLGILEADLLGKCFYSERNDLNLGAVVVPTLAESVAYEGVYTDVIRHITPNVMQLNALAGGIEVAARLAGIESKLNFEQVTLTPPAPPPAENQGKRSRKNQKPAPAPKPVEVLSASFTDNLGSFEQHLYSTQLKDFIKPSQSFQALSDKCYMTNQKECGLYFVGQDVQRLLGKNAGEHFALGQNIRLPQFEVESAESFFSSGKGDDGTSFFVPLDRYGSGRYTIASIDLAQIRKAQAKNKPEKEISSQDVLAVTALTEPTANKILVEIEPASIEMRNIVAESMNAATRTIGGKLPAEYIEEMRAEASKAEAEQAAAAENAEENSEVDVETAPEAEAGSETTPASNTEVAAAGAEVTGNGTSEGTGETDAANTELAAAQTTGDAGAADAADANTSVAEKAAEGAGAVVAEVAADVASDVAAEVETEFAKVEAEVDKVEAEVEKVEAEVEAEVAKVETEVAKVEAEVEKVEAEERKFSLSASVAGVLSESTGLSSSKNKPAPVKLDPPLDAEVGIPVYFNEMGMPAFGLRNTILSYGDYKNYNFLTELEMMVLSDMGYSIESAEFYGSSIYSQGNPNLRYAHRLSRDFGLYDHKTKIYDATQPSLMPSAVGLHVYGDYNDIAHGSVYNLGGVGSIGVRIDGCDNFYYQQSNSVIESSGLEGSGIAFTYGKNNSAYIGGKVVASGAKGVAIRADMGSNINSDLVEYRGSYIRARSLDYIEGRLTKQEAASVPLLPELAGPQVENLTISGQVSGRRAAIFIDESSLVRNINVSALARISGGIYSIWNPNIDGAGNIKVRHDSRRSKLLDANIQYPVGNTGETMRELAARELTTHLNLGVKLDERNQVMRSEQPAEGRHEEILVGDPQSRTVIDGNVSGGSIKIRQFGGKNEIKGDVRAYEIELFDGVLKITAQESAIHQLNHLKLRPYTVLDLVDGKWSSTYVQEETYFGRNSTVRVDVDSEGNLLDQLTHMGQLYADDYQLRVEPAVSYETLKSLASNPKTMLNFITNFMQKTNEHLDTSSVSLRFPRYIWDAAGSYGREIKCGAKGCRVGGFVSNEEVSKFDNIQPWRYYLAFGGIFLFVVGFYITYFFKCFKRKKAR